MSDPSKPRPIGISVFAVVWLSNGIGGAVFGLMGFAPTTLLADTLGFSYPVPSWVAAAARVSPDVNLGIWAIWAIFQTVTGLGLWKLKNWARWIVIAQLALFLVGPNLGALIFGSRYYFTFPSLWERLLLHGAFLLLGGFLLRYLLSPPIARSFSPEAKS